MFVTHGFAAAARCLTSHATIPAHLWLEQGQFGLRMEQAESCINLILANEMCVVIPF